MTVLFIQRNHWGHWAEFRFLIIIRQECSSRTLSRYPLHGPWQSSAESTAFVDQWFWTNSMWFFLKDLFMFSTNLFLSGCLDVVPIISELTSVLRSYILSLCICPGKYWTPGRPNAVFHEVISSLHSWDKKSGHKLSSLSGSLCPNSQLVLKMGETEAVQWERKMQRNGRGANATADKTLLFWWNTLVWHGGQPTAATSSNFPYHNLGY